MKNTNVTVLFNLTIYISCVRFTAAVSSGSGPLALSKRSLSLRTKIIIRRVGYDDFSYQFILFSMTYKNYDIFNLFMSEIDFVLEV